MGAMAPPPEWVPEDDVLLKNAVEAGASLEYLAKGAVQFSRRFTFQELKDRWRALLYDPIISVEASSRMAEVERSAVPNQWRPSKVDGVKEFTYSSGKRKAESIRKCYYAMRKRICNEPLDLMDINLHSNFGDGNELSSADGRINNLGIQSQDFDIRHQFFPESTGNSSLCGVQSHSQDLHLGGEDVPHNPSYPYQENITLTEDCSRFNQSKDLPLFEAEGLANEESACPEFGDLPFSSCPPTWHTSQAAGTPIQIGEKDQQTSTQVFLAELSSALFDADTDPPLFMDNDEKDALEKSYLDGLSSLLLDSPSPSELPIACLGEATDDHLIDTNGVHDGSLNAQEEPCSLPAKSLGLEYRNGVIWCTLNTEDTEIPSNDDVFLPFRCPSPSASTGARWRPHEPSYQMSSPVKEFSTTSKAHGGALLMINDQKDSRAPPQMIGSSDKGLRYPTGDHGAKFELPKSNIESAALRNARNIECPNRSDNVNANNFVVGMVNRGSLEMEHEKNKPVGRCPDKHEIGLGIPQSLQKNATCSRNGLGAKAETRNNVSLNAELSSQHTGVPMPIDQSLLSGQEELWSEDEFDVPYFSDVEAMILDMDLSPDEFDKSTLPEVQQYQHEETKRTIIRLEQAADACTQRTIAGQGAFAVLCGRYSKYFIKKPEVLLGRATDDIKVDIDLGREKDGGKISRRQAIMKMDMNGVFHLKNLGKSLIYVNGSKVESGESVNLNSGCLIEVRDLAFLFETNHKIVKQFVDSVGEGGVSGGS